MGNEAATIMFLVNALHIPVEQPSPLEQGGGEIGDVDIIFIDQSRIEKDQTLYTSVFGCKIM